METRPAPRIVYVDRLDNRVVIGFDDGKTALYSADLLYSIVGTAQEMVEPEEGQEMQAGVEEGKQTQHAAQLDQPVPAAQAPQRRYR